MSIDSEISFHDANIVSIDVFGYPEVINLTFSIINKGFVKVSFQNCKMLRVIDLLSNNIVSRLVKYDSDLYVEDEIRNLLIWGSSTSDGESYLSPESISEYLSEIRAGGMKLFYVEPSYGAELVIVSSGHEIAL